MTWFPNFSVISIIVSFGGFSCLPWFENLKGSAAAADPLVGQVPLVVDMTLREGGYEPPGQNFGVSKLGSLGVFRAWDL